MCKTVMKHLCSHCGTELEIAVRSYPMGSALAKERFHADVYCCPKCKKIELFASEERDIVVCPVCGSSHPAHEKCITCALNAAFDGSHTK